MNDSGFPRRSHLNRMVLVERAFHDAKIAIERLGADVRLTEARMLLSAAFEKVADFIDDQNAKRGKR